MAYILSHVMGVMIYHLDRRDTLIQTESLDFAERLAEFLIHAYSLSGEDRQLILALIPSSTGNWPGGEGKFCTLNDVADDIQAYFATVLRGTGISTDVCIIERSRSAADAQNRASSHDILVKTALDDISGEAFIFSGQIPNVPSFFDDVSLTYLLIGSSVILSAALWVIIRITKPLYRLADAAIAVSKNLDTMPLPESGPTEVKWAAQAFNLMQARLQRLIEGQTDMLAAISHDLRTQITRLRLRTELLDDGQDVRKLRAGLDEMEAMVNSVIEFVRGAEPGETVRRAEVGALVGSLCQDLKDEGLPVAYSAAESEIYLNCRLLTIKRALQNLIDNAIKFGGCAKARVSVRAQAIVIEIDDEGPGIPEQMKDKVVLPFFRLESSRSRETGGVGLGLSIAVNAIHAHGGSIEFMNLPDKGLRVTVYLPVDV